MLTASVALSIRDTDEAVCLYTGIASPLVRISLKMRFIPSPRSRVIPILEIELGIARLARKDVAQANRLQSLFEQDLLEVFKGIILSIDVAVARRAARLHVPDPRPERDTLIAATAIANDMTIVTRNVADFEPMGVALINPWSSLQS